MTWLDTFDWKLHRKGHELAFRRSNKEGEAPRLELLGTSSKAQPGEAPCSAAPQFAQDVSESHLRSSLERLAKRRALIPSISADVISKTASIKDNDGKTLARLRLERASVEDSGSQSPRVLTWVRLTAVRGYEAELDTVGQSLIDAGAEKADASILEDMMQGRHRTPGDYRSKPEFWLNPAMRSDLAVLGILNELSEKMDANEQGVLNDIDQDFLKHYRVAIRRSRSALSLFKSALPHNDLLSFRDHWQSMGRLAGDVRDLDVLLNLIADHLDGIEQADHDALEPLSVHIAQTRDWRRAELVAGINSPDYQTLRADWRRSIRPTCKKTLSTSAEAKQPVQVLAASSIRKAHRRVIRDGRRIKKASAPEVLHDMRKQCKKLRYVLEFFSSLYAPVVMERILTPLQALQDVLGAFQDLEVQKLELRRAADQLSRNASAPAETYVALGRLMAAMDVEKKAARVAFKASFDDLLTDDYLEAMSQISDLKEK